MATTQLDLAIQALDLSLTNGKIKDGEISGAKIASDAAIAYSKLSLSNSIQNSDIASAAAIAYSKLNLTSSILNADISASAAIAYSKLSLADSIVNADINSSAAITYGKLSLSNSIVNADIATAAGIVYSKLSLSNSIVNADINASAAIAYSKLSLANSILNADINTAAGIVYSKLSLSDSIVNADINTSAAIAYSKLNLSGSVTNGDLAGSIADDKLATSYIKADGTRAFTGDQSMGNHDLTGLPATPSGATSATSKAYVDNIASGLVWIPPAAVRNLVGNASVATLNGLSPVGGDAYVVTDSGSLTRGSVSVSAGDLVEDDGTNWVLIRANSGGYVPAGLRAILAKSTALISPYTEATDDNKIATFSGSSNTASLSDPVDGNSILITDLASAGYWDNTGWVFEADGSIPAGNWVQWTGAAGINAGDGLGKSGNTIFVNPGDGVVLVTDTVSINLDGGTLSKSGSGLKVASGGITNTEVNASAAIAGTKISPNFGSQDVLTTAHFAVNVASPSQPFEVAAEDSLYRMFQSTSATTNNTYTPGFRARRSRGTLASPSAVQGGDNLLQVDTISYGATGWAANPRAQMHFIAAENWTDSAQGTFIRFNTTASGGTTTSEKVRISDAGNLGVLNNNPQYPVDVTGDINYTGTLRKSGTQVTSAILSDEPDLAKYSDFSNKGELLVGSGSGAAQYLAVGANGTALVADSGEVVGMKWASVAVGSVATRETPSGLVNGSNTVYVLAHTPLTGSEEVYLNGLQQDPGAGNDYTISTDTITFASAPPTGSKIRVTYRY